MAIHIDKIYPLGDAAIVVKLGNTINKETHNSVRVLSNYLHKHPIIGMTEYVPSFTSVTIYYDMKTVAIYGKDSSFNNPYELLHSTLSHIVESLDTTSEVKPKIIEIPVCYGGDFGPDLEHVAEHNNLTTEQVINIHSQGEYLTYMVGFAPGFPYLGGLSEKIATPRRETPRLKIPAGTVGIAGMQTGVYPLDSPGGWQCIGRTPTRLFRPDNAPPTLIQMGNIIKFTPISISEYEQLLEVRD